VRARLYWMKSGRGRKHHSKDAEKKKTGNYLNAEKQKNAEKRKVPRWVFSHRSHEGLKLGWCYVSSTPLWFTIILQSSNQGLFMRETVDKKTSIHFRSTF